MARHKHKLLADMSLADDYYGDDDDDYYTSSSSSQAGSDDELQVLVHKPPPCGHDGGDHGTPRRDHRRHDSASRSLRRAYHQQRYMGLIRSTVVSASVLLLVAAFSSFCLVQVLLARRAAYSHSITARPIQPQGHPVQHAVSAFQNHLASGDEPGQRFDAIQHELDERYRSINAPVSTMICEWTQQDSERYTALLRPPPPHRQPTDSHGGPRYLFAMNLYNNQQVVPALAQTLLQLARLLGPHNVMVSVFENGSTDNTTLALAHTAAAFTAAGVEHSILSDSRKTDWRHVDRIAQLSLYRNYVLRPLNVSSSSSPNSTVPARPFEHVIFINDVFLCPRDVLELVHQRTTQQADAACAMDWRATKPWFGSGWWFGRRAGVKFYDNWVARSLSGNLFRARVDIISEFREGIDEILDQSKSAVDDLTRQRFKHGLPMPVYSCWNGVIALPAAPFTSIAEGSSSSPSAPVEFRSTLNTADSCPGASECKTLARDFWARGFKRWVVVPRVHVTYEREIYDHPSLVRLSSLPPPSSSSSSSASAVPSSNGTADSMNELIDWATLPAPESVACYPWHRGLKIETDEMRAKPFRR